MTKVEMALRQVERKIEDAENTIRETRKQIIVSLNAENMEYEANFILGYAATMQRMAELLPTLREQKKMLECIAED